jgi:hypothetical protein
VNAIQAALNMLFDELKAKMKAWLVADGRDQFIDLYPNKSLPTVAIHSVFMVLGLVAVKQWRVMVKNDFYLRVSINSIVFYTSYSKV